MFTANLLDIHEQVVRSRSGRTYMSENLDRISKAFISALLGLPFRCWFKARIWMAAMMAAVTFC